MRLSSVKAKEVEWLWEPYIPVGMVTLVTGDPEAGKGWVTMDIAASVSQGRGLPGDDREREKGRVLFFSAEDSPEYTLLPRLQKQKADPDRVWFVSKVYNMGSPAGMEKLERAIVRTKPVMVVIDPVTAWIGETDTNKITVVNEIYGKLAALADKHRVAIVTVRHRRKPADGERKGRDPKFGGAGSIAFTGSARSELLVGLTEDGQHAMAHEKCSVGKKGVTRLFELDKASGTLTWGEESDLTGWDLIGSMAKKKGKKGKGQQAVEFLKDFLANGPEPAQTVIEVALGKGITKATLVAAKPGVVKAFRRDDRWWWTLEGASVAPGELLVCK